MTAHAAVGINDDLSAGQTAVTLWTADNKASGWVDEDLGIVAHQFLWNDGVDDMFLDVSADLLHLNIWRMLVGDDDGFNSNRNIVFILDGYLGLAVWTQIRQGAVFAYLCQTFCQLVCQRNRQRHQLWGIVAGKAEHHALVAGAVVLLAAGSFFCFQRLVNAHGDVAGLFVNRGDNAAGIAVKAEFCTVVADFADDFACQMRDIDIAVGADLTHNHDHTGGNGSFAGNTAVRVFFEDSVEHCIGDLVTDFVGMSFGDRLGGKEIFCHWWFLPFLNRGLSFYPFS